MIRGLYTAASGMVAQQHKLDTLSNNLANVDLTGYKADIAVQKSFPELLIRRLNDDGLFNFPQGCLETAPVVGKLGTGIEHNESFTVFSQGSLRETGNSFDFALEGVEGVLLSKEGYPVLGESGMPIHVKLNNFTVNSQGQILHNPLYQEDPKRLVGFMENDWQETQILDTLKIVNFQRPRYAKKEGGSLWYATETSGSASLSQGENRPVVRQGFTETSNVNAVQEMVRMICVNRAYEANQKTIATHDALLAASGMTGQQFNMDTISNNLSNVNTTGFKKVRAEFEDLLYQTIQTAAGLTAVGQNCFKSTIASGEAIGATPSKEGMGLINQGFLEMSNVSVVQEMVNMIVAQRAYEINSKAVQTSDAMLGIANNLKAR
ncbi:UNVERIFIED_CONTAM: hypothetical protein PYX00_011058 [Menopon gallinae]|uniref:Flagellar basal body protein n=1 Tax=Menopon gallinae TaxID=328185 RepID=A0AAW2H6S0_9NEOP